ncbi:MAG: class I SAM-dependent methyltransferase [Acidimicrobiales bacterium]
MPTEHSEERATAFSHLETEEKQRRSGSFGDVAGHYERYRPGPPVAALDWFLPDHVATVVDLGAGTGALTRLLLDRADEVIAVEPDDRMRDVLIEQVPGAMAVKGRGESMPLPDNFADAVLASASWHWMDVKPALREVGRILVPGGVLGAIWSGPDPEGAFLVQSQQLLMESSSGGSGSALASVALNDTNRMPSILEIPDGVPFDQPEVEVFKWEMPLTADEIVGMLGTMSSFILLDDETRQAAFSEARRLLRDLLGIEGDATVNLEFRAEAYKSIYRG